SDPEVASAGHTEDSAREAGLSAKAVTVPITALGRAATMGARDGFTQLVVDRDRDAIVGVHIVGPHASDLIAEGVLAIELAAAPAQVVKDITAAGGTAGTYPASVGDLDALDGLVAAVAADLGPIDILVNNAGMASRGQSVVDTDPAELPRLMAVNALGPHRLAQ